VESDLAPLGAVGLSDRGLHDLVAVVAYFNFVNRMAAGLGVEVEETQ
jgi:alkylhydroperoxidase family enzyme